MATNMTTETLVIRDQAGTYYLLTPDILAEARATAEQVAAIARQSGDDTAGFQAQPGKDWIEAYVQGRLPFQVVGMVVMPPAQRFEPNRQSLAPCI